MSLLQGETIPILASRDIAESVAFYERLGFARRETNVYRLALD